MRPSAKRLLVVYGIAALVIGLDQFIKWVVIQQLAGRPPLRLIGDVVDLRYTTNSGGAFSLFTGAPVFFALTAIVVIGGLVYASSRTRGLPIAVALGLLLGGAVGNVLDRLLRGDHPLRGEVVDFVKIGPWPLFNLADSCIVVGGILLALLLGRPDRSADQRGERPAPPGGDGAAAPAPDPKAAPDAEAGGGSQARSRQP
jgi:signal peptidase II